MNIRQRLGVLLAVAGWGLVLLALAATVYLWLARPVVTGYAAKHLCSGMWVSELPQDWLQQQAIAPALQPASSWLEYLVDEPQRSVSVSFLGYSQTARWAAGRGCTLLTDVDSELVAATSLQSASEVNLPSSEVGATGHQNASRSMLPQGWVLDNSRLEALLDAAFDEPLQSQTTDGKSIDHSPRNTLAILVAHKGQLILERYKAPVNANTPMLGWSMTKSLLASWIAVANQQQPLNLLEQPVDALWPSVGPEMTLEHLLRMQSGLAFEEWYQPTDDVTTMLYKTADMAALVADQPLEAEPGSFWQYSSGDSNLAASVWVNAVAGDWHEWLQQYFWQPLGIDDATVESDMVGTPVASSYSYMSASSWLRVGQFWLDSWHGRVAEELPVATDWMTRTTTPTLQADGGYMYGMGFWLNRADPTLENEPERQLSKRFPDLPETVFWARGHDGQYVLVAPEQELVVVRLGLTPGMNDGMNTLVAGLLDALGASG